MFCSIGVVAYTINAKDISFTPDNSNWHVDNLNDAINDLYKSGEVEVLLKNGYSYTFTKDYNKIIIIDGRYRDREVSYTRVGLDTLSDYWRLAGSNYAVSIYIYENVKAGDSITFNGTCERGMAILNIN